MDSLIAKKGEGLNGGYSIRCYRLRNCELMQYKKGIEKFTLCTDKTLKRRYNIYNISSISIGHTKAPYVLQLSYNEETSLDLKFNDEKNKKQKLNHAKFCCWYRIVCATSKIPYNVNCKERPLPSNICFTLYYLLQSLYQHKEMLNTKFIFQKSLQGTSSNKHVQKFYYNLMVNGRKFSNDLISKSNNTQIDNEMDIYLLSKTLIYTLQNMPTSLFCDNNCSLLTTFIGEQLEKCLIKKKLQDNNFNESIKNIPEYEDIDIYCIDKQSLKDIKEKLLQIYSQNRKEFKKKNGFDLFNRYGFLTIIFLLLSNISSNVYYKTTSMSAAQLAIQFNEALQSKQYLYHCRTEILISSNKSKQYNKYKSSKYEQQFIKMLKILIYFAHDLFPDVSRIKWKVKHLVIAQSTEKLMTKRYNDNFSRDTKNKYYIPSILRNSIEYGVFDAKYFCNNNDEYLKPIINIQSNSAAKQYKVKRILSYNNMPAYNSDIGNSDIEQKQQDDESSIDGSGSGSGSQSPHITQKITFDDDGYKQDDEKESLYQENNNNNNNAEINNDIDNNYNYNNDTSWLANCEMCLYAPIMSIFGNSNNNNQYYDDQKQQQQPQQQQPQQQQQEKEMSYVKTEQTEKLYQSTNNNEPTGDYNNNEETNYVNIQQEY